MKRTLILFLLLWHTARGDAQTWTGSTSNNWFTASNWSPASVPGSGSSVTIPGSLSVYPALTGNVVIAGFSMASGSALNLGGYSFTNNGNISVTGATINGGGSFTSAGGSGVYVASSQFTTTLSITNYTSVCDILDNTITGNTTISDASSQNSGHNYIDGNLFTGNLSLTHASATDLMYEGYGSAVGPNHVTGNATFSLSGSGEFQSGYAHNIQVDGNLTVTRTSAGTTQLFISAGGGVGGNLSYTTSGGNSVLGLASGNTVAVAGTINISALTAASFHMYKLKNGATGGSVSIAGATNLDIQHDTLKADVSITGYTSVCYIYDNSFTGTSTISDAASQNSGANYIDGNLFTGNLTLTHASTTDDMYEGYGAPSGNGNRITGNAAVNISGAGSFYSAYSHPISVAGNLSINRTTGGQTQLFVTPSSGIGGNFSFTTNGGNTYLNPGSLGTELIGGTFSLSVSGGGLFAMYRVKNNTTGGAVTVAGSSNQNVQRDTLIATVNFTGYTYASNIWDNSFTGATTISDAAGQNSGANYIDGNLFTGNLTITHASATDDMYEGYGSPSANGNRVTGNATSNLSGAGRFFFSYDHGTRVDGSLTVNRSVGGYTNLFHNSVSAGSVGGSFSYTTAGGNTYINDQNQKLTLISGSISVNAPAAGVFQMFRVQNLIGGGTIAVVGSNLALIQNDTLIATVSITGNAFQSSILDNSITGNTTISDVAAQNSGSNSVDGNLFNGDLSITHASSTDVMYEGNGSGGANGNRVTGDATFTLSGAGGFQSSYSHSLLVNGNLTVSRTVAGNTTLFRSTTAGSIGGNLSFTTVGGNSDFNVTGTETVPVAGTINISATGGGQFFMYRMKNSTAGGTVSVIGAGNQDIRNDTLIATCNFTGYTSVNFCYDNKFTGNVTISDASAQNSGSNNIDGNFFIGDLSVTHASVTDVMNEGFGSPSSNNNHVTGNATFTLSGGGQFISSYSRGITVDGNLTINRSVSGNTYLFNALSGTGSVGGNFSYTNTGGGNTNISVANAAVVPVGGTFNVNITNGGIFHMYRMKNNVAGGNVTVVGSNNVDIGRDTLKGNVSITGYTSVLSILANSFTGNTLVADANTQNSGSNYLDDNLFNGAFTLVHSSTTDNVVDGYSGPVGYGNRVVGKDSIVNLPGANTLYMSYSHPHRADGDFVLNAPSGVLIASLIFGGNTDGHLRQSNLQSPMASAVYLAKTGSAKLFLDSALGVSGNLSFTSGYIVASNAHPLVFANGATYSGAGDGSHVLGTVIKAGAQAFTFPLGDGGSYSPAGITGSGATTDTFSASYVRALPHSAGYDSAQHDVSINHISRSEYWLINRAVSTTNNVKVTLGFNSRSGVTDMSKLTVAHWYNNGTSTAWHDEGSGSTSGTNSLGTIQSNNTISSFSPFTLASTTVANPLPVKLIAFDAVKEGGSAKLTWQSAEEKQLETYRVERSSDGRMFSPVGNVKPFGTASNYQINDAQPLAGMNYYRLAMIDQNGSIAYSAVRSLYFGRDGLAADISLFPNPTPGILNIKGLSQWSDATLTVKGIDGQLLQRTQLTGEDQLSIFAGAWPTGMYWVTISDGNRSTQQSFIKQ